MVRHSGCCVGRYLLRRAVCFLLVVITIASTGALGLSFSWQRLEIGRGRIQTCRIESDRCQLGTSRGDIIEIEADGTMKLLPERSEMSAVWSLQLGANNDTVIGDARGRVHSFRRHSWTTSPKRLSGWVRAMTLDHENNIYAVGCNIVTKFDSSLRALYEFDAGPSAPCEESWRRHDITAVCLTRHSLFCGLVDGSLRQFDLESRALLRRAPPCGSRIIALLHNQDRILAISRDGSLLSFSSSSLHENSSLVSSLSNKSLALTAAAILPGVLLALGTSDGSLLMLDPSSLTPLETSTFDLGGKRETQTQFFSQSKKSITSVAVEKLDNNGSFMLALADAAGELVLATGTTTHL